MSDEIVDFDTYNDMCTECSRHNECHKYGIDYDKIARCKGLKT